MRFSSYEKRLFYVILALLAMAFIGVHYKSGVKISEISEKRSGDLISKLSDTKVELPRVEKMDKNFDSKSKLAKMEITTLTNQTNLRTEPNIIPRKPLTPNSNDFIVVGIPTIQRPEGANYLEETLTSLLTKRLIFNRVIFVVYIGDTDVDRVKTVKESVLKNHAKDVESGLIHIIHPPADIYPVWETEMKITLGDPRHQVKWRSKQNLDQAYLMDYAYSLKPKYYLSLEDDVSAVENYLETIFKYAEEGMSDDIVIISYCKWGAIGKLFSAKFLPTLVQYLRTFWNYKPLDWLFSDLLHIIACRYPPKDCDKDINAIKRDYPKELFTHNGKVSSLEKKKT